MSTTRCWRSGILAVGLAALLVICGPAVPRVVAAAESSYGDANAPAPPAPMAAAPEVPTAGPAVLKRASQVMDAPVRGVDGTLVGRVRDLVLTPDLHGISYVAVSSGGMLGFGRTWHAVPWSALHLDVRDTYAVSLSAAQFKDASVFLSPAWPSSAEPGWAAGAREAGSAGPTAGTMTNVQDRRFTRIRGARAEGSLGVKAGDVRDLMIVMNTGQIAYTILSYGGVLGIGARYAAVPESAITLEPARRLARVDVTVATVHANSFSPSRWPNLSSSVFAQQLDRAYGVPGSSMTVLGYVPPEGTAYAAAPAARTPPKPAARATPPSSRARLPGEPTAEDLTGTFNPAKVTSVEGTVLDEGKFRTTPTGPEMLWLRIRTNDNRTLLVNLGPRSYISEQKFYVVPGDRIHLSGSEVPAEARGREVFLPTEITYEDQTLRLRNATGTPLWEGQGTTTPAPTTPGRQPGATTTPSTSTPAKPQSRAGAAGTPPLGYVPGQTTEPPGAQTPPPATAGSLPQTTPRTATEPNEPNQP